MLAETLPAGRKGNREHRIKWMKAVGLLRFYNHHEIELSGYELIILQDKGRRTWKWFGDWQGHCCTTGPGDRVSSFSVLKDKASLVSGGQDATTQFHRWGCPDEAQGGDNDATSVGLKEDHWANKDCLGTLRIHCSLPRYVLDLFGTCCPFCLPFFSLLEWECLSYACLTILFLV